MRLSDDVVVGVCARRAASRGWWWMRGLVPIVVRELRADGCRRAIDVRGEV